MAGENAPTCQMRVSPTLARAALKRQNVIYSSSPACSPFGEFISEFASGVAPAGAALQSRRCRELGMFIALRYLVTVRRATVRPCLASSLTSSSSL